MKRNKLGLYVRILAVAGMCLFTPVIIMTGCGKNNNGVENELTPSTTLTPTLTPTPKPKDTVAPIVTAKEVKLVAADNLSVVPEQFIADIQDESECSTVFLTEPNYSAYGKQSVQLEIKDSEGNSTVVEAQLCIINVKESISMELGGELPTAEEFLFAPGSEISFATDISTISTMVEAAHEISLIVDGVETVSCLQIIDSTAPDLVLKTAETWLNKPIDLSAFVDYDLTADNSDAFEAAYISEPDWTLVGEQDVSIVATDPSGNATTQTTTLVIKKDEKAPVVTATDIDVQVGGTVSYKKAVSYYDDIDTKEEMKLSIERTGVDLKTIGTYQVIYTVTDCSGNATSVTAKINVMEEAPKWQDEDAIHEKAQSILAKILTDDMTDREKARAIYRFIKSNIGYSGHSEKGNYMRGAYEGLFKYTGDCFVYAATAKELLTQAGIPNIDIVKSRTNPSHYWNLVYIEDGWYHFDSTPRKDKSEFFLLTDEELEAYSSTHNDTHIFDRSLYPEIK